MFGERPEILLKSEERLTYFTEQQGRIFEQNETNLLHSKIDKIMSAPDSEEILTALPSAKEYVKAWNKRKKALESQTILGQAQELLDNWEAEELDKLAATEAKSRLDQINLLLLIDEQDLGPWRTIIETAVKEQNMLGLINAIGELLSLIKIELVETNLPPTPPMPQDLEDE